MKGAIQVISQRVLNIGPMVGLLCCSLKNLNLRLYWSGKNPMPRATVVCAMGKKLEGRVFSIMTWGSKGRDRCWIHDKEELKSSEVLVRLLVRRNV